MTNVLQVNMSNNTTTLALSFFYYCLAWLADKMRVCVGFHLPGYAVARRESDYLRAATIVDIELI